MITTKKFETFCNIAQHESEKSPMKTKLGAAIVYKGKLVNLGYNSNDRSYMNGNSYTAIHAEISAISQFIRSSGNNNSNQNMQVKEDMSSPQQRHYREKKIKKIDIIVVRYNSINEPVISRPCNMCIDYMRGLIGIQIKNVYYFDISGNLVCEKLKDMQKLHTPKVWLTVNLNKSYIRCTGVRIY